MRKAIGGRGLLGVALLAGAVALAGCGSGSSKSSSSSPTGATATQTVKRLEVTVVSKRAEAPGARSFVAWAREIFSLGRNAEAAVCQVTANNVGPVPTDAGGKAIIPNVPVNPDGTIPVTIVCGVTTNNVTLTGTPGAVVAVTVEVEPNKVEVKAKSEHVSQPSQVSQPSTPSEPSKPKPPSS